MSKLVIAIYPSDIYVAHKRLWTSLSALFQIEVIPCQSNNSIIASENDKLVIFDFDSNNDSKNYDCNRRYFVNYLI